MAAPEAETEPGEDGSCSLCFRQQPAREEGEAEDTLLAQQRGGAWGRLSPDCLEQIAYVYRGQVTTAAGDMGQREGCSSFVSHFIFGFFFFFEMVSL
jgi:hypothetical protein